MQIATAQVNNALNKLGQIVPNATVQNTADIGAYFAQQLNSIIDILVAIASLSMIAGIIIIANAVALAMLERRRELGILKAVGYTSSSVLSEVLIENGIVGGVGAFIAMLLATAATLLLGSLLFNMTLSVSPSSPWLDRWLGPTCHANRSPRRLGFGSCTPTGGVTLRIKK